MSIFNQVRDLMVWAGEVCVPEPTSPPARALGVVKGRPVRVMYSGSGYVPDGPASSGDRLPLFISSDQALAGSFLVAGEAALHGAGPARIELSRRCPFPLDQAAWGLSRKAEGWQDSAPWSFAALPRSKLEALRKQLSDAGAKPTGAFAVVDGTPIALTGIPRALPRSLIAAITATVIAALIAVASVSYSANQIEAEASARLADARAKLDEAEAMAANALAERTAASTPIEAAKAVLASLNAAPPVGATLAALTQVIGDEAHVRRLRISPGIVEGEFIAPDAAALAAQIGSTTPFTSARLKTAARTDGTTGLQAATLEIVVEPTQ